MPFAVDGSSAVPPPSVMPPLAARGRVRPVAEPDVPALSELYVRVFGAPPGDPACSAPAYMRRVLFEHPWRDDELPPVMYEDADGRPAGLLGVVARPMLFRGERVRVALCHHFMVAPETRVTLASIAMTRAVLRGPQDLTIAEACAPWRQLWEQVGGTTSLLHGLTWTRVLRPCAFTLGYLRRRGLPAACARLLQPLSHAADRVAARLAHTGAIPPPSELRGEPLDVAGLLAAMQQLCVGTLQSVWNHDTLQWLLEHLKAKVHRGTFFAIGVNTDRGAVDGCYLYFLKPGGVSQLVFLAARRGRERDVLAHLVRHAWDHGAGAIAGQVDRATCGSLAGSPAVLTQSDENWRLIHSRRPELLSAVHSGEALLSRLESEWWLTY